MAKGLDGAHILVTRPEHQAQTLCQLITQTGGKAILFPTLDIIYRQGQPEIIDLISKLDQASFIIFLSANAVSVVADTIKSYWPTLPVPTKIIAIGQGTRNALLAKGLPVDFMPTDASSEGLLALPALQAIQDKTLIVFKGEGGRGILLPAFAKRGAQVHEAIVYHRVCPTIEISEQFMRWKKEGIDAIVTTSGESLTNLFSLIPDKEWLNNQVFVVISQRIAQQAKDLGVQHCIVANDASDDAIFAALCTAIDA